MGKGKRKVVSVVKCKHLLTVSHVDIHIFCAQVIVDININLTNSCFIIAGSPKPHPLSIPTKSAVRQDDEIDDYASVSMQA